MNSLPNTTNKLRSVVAFVLMLWCAGAGCMLVSYARTAAMQCADEPEATSDSSATHSCHHGGGAPPASTHRAKPARRHRDEVAQSQTATLAETLPASDALSCCPLTSGAFVTASRTQANETDAAITLAEESALPGLTKSGFTRRDAPLRLPDQEQTYLRCCSFLI